MAAPQKIMLHLLRALSQSVLLLLPLVSFGRAQDGGCSSCNLQPNCKNVTTLNLNVQQYANLSPFYVPIFSIPSPAWEPNSCSTYFPINNSTYLLFITTYDCYGKITVKPFIIADLDKDYPGVYRVQGLFGDLGNETTVHNSYIVNAACSSCQPIYISYRCFFFDSCEFVNYEYDIVYGLSSSADNAPSCLDKFEQLVSDSGLQVSNFTRATGEPRCVVYFNGAPCVNFQNVDPAYAISYPEDVTEPSC